MELVASPPLRLPFLAPRAARAARMPRWQRAEASASGPRTVAVIGGGVAGLACAKRLGELGVSATVFDTGKRGPGGRASSRQWRGQVVDHASQFIATTDPEFRELIASSGAARPLQRFGRLRKDGFQPEDGDRWVGIQGMGGIVSKLAEGVNVRQDIWVPPSNGLSVEDGSWSVAIPGPTRATERFDAAVIAHNGKCAERLTSSTPAREVHALLRTNFAASVTRAQPGCGRFTLNQIYSLLFEVPKGLMPTDFAAAFVENEPILRWLSSNTAKLQQSAECEVWTALSSPSFGKQHKAPQEFLEGTAKEAEVIELMLAAVERAVALPSGSLQAASATKLQLWGAALPITRWASRDATDFAWSSAHRIGIAGDWLSSCPERASTIEAAWLSGVRLAEHIAKQPAEDAGIQLGESGGAFVPVEADFGGGGSAPGAWVDPEKGKGKGKGKGRKGWKG
ncbi:unnamed protein product [Effrenium voratum]|uniref:Amine oxidase domain-containing protein n=1 Tax=Effrenium voratum TaxID=2562239 RepID=A0AA36HVJ4_9DINO|nr:unnamed protein product [Effrenium voratum]CAJ1376133.1 unnamed protein product [Effrenium voratum]CAJ1424746.1 unnamed protein product [Effrenium voratum]